MPARIRLFLNLLSDTFWILPAVLVLAGGAGAFGFLALDRSGLISKSILAGPWLYNGGATGARTLLGAVASSTIGVAGTVFSITIAALSLAAGQMGPRLLRNFVRDRGNQLTLGIFLGTFSYALLVLRSVRTPDEGDFIPHVALTVAVALALLCVATLVYFVGHMAQRINVDVVIDLVSEDMRSAIRRLTTTDEQAMCPPADMWRRADIVRDDRRGYLQHIDEQGLIEWAQNHQASIKLLIRPGDYVFPGAPTALVVPPIDETASVIRNATALAAQRSSSDDLEYAVRQLVEVAVRALSPGINDPHTAISVLDRLGAALCDLAPVSLLNGVTLREGRCILVMSSVDYAGLTDSMFHLIRQNAAGTTTVLIRLLDVLSAVASVERDPERLQSLKRHADIVRSDAERTIQTVADLTDLRSRHRRFLEMAEKGANCMILADR